MPFFSSRDVARPSDLLSIMLGGVSLLDDVVCCVGSCYCVQCKSDGSLIRRKYYFNAEGCYRSLAGLAKTCIVVPPSFSCEILRIATRGAHLET